jgi:hypothetical protein
VAIPRVLSLDVSKSSANSCSKRGPAVIESPCSRIRDPFSSQCCAEPYATGNDSTSVAGYESLSTPPDSDVITPLSSGEAAPIRAAQLQEWHALSQAQGSAYNPYFPPLPERPGIVHGYPKDLDGHHPEFHSVM